MAIGIVKFREKEAYGVYEFLCDFDSDVKDLRTDCAPGSKAQVAESGKNYVFNSLKQWKEIKGNSDNSENINNYEILENKPQINGNTLSGNKTLDDLDLQGKLTAGTNITIANDGTISASGGVTDYDQLSNKPSINNNTLTGNKTFSQLGLQSELVSGTNIKTINNISILGSGNINIEGEASKPLSSKFIHMSVDDTSQVVAGINSSSVTSIYNIPLISYFKQMHDTYGMVFSFYVQNIAFNFDTTTTPGQEKKAELFAARDWLKWGLHNATGSSSTNYVNATYETGQTDWNNFVANIITYIGTTEAVDRIPRLENFASSEVCAQGMRDAKCGAMGFLGADDTRADNAWLTAAESKWLGGWASATTSNNWVPNDYWTDYSNGLRVYKTDLRLELFGGTRNNIDNPQVTTSLYDALVEWYTDIRHGNAFCPMILFTHEQRLISSYSSQVSSTYQTYLADIGRFGNDYGVAFDFPQNKFIATPQKLDRFPTIGGTTVVANPTLDGTEANLTGLQVSGTKYKVSNSPVAVTGVSVPSTQTVEENGTCTISATISPADASNKNVTWSIESGSNLVSITPNGLDCEISGSNTGTGTAVIRATTVDGSYTADCTVTVVGAIIPVTGITLSSNSLALDADTTPSGTITATIVPANATAQTVNYIIQSGNCVSISQNGLSCTITMVSKGTATVRCSATDSSGVYADCEVTCTLGTLPAGYTELEYVESPTKDCSVSTGITLETGKSYTYDTRIQFTDLTGAPGKDYSFNGANDGAFVGMNCRTVASPRLVFGDTSKESTYGIAADLLPHTFVCPFTCKSTSQTLTYTIDGNLYFNQRNNINPEPVYVFSTNPTNVGPKYSYFCQEKVYWFKVYKEGTLVANLIPCRRDADGEYGMYDIVQNVFRENLGTGTLTGA